MSGHTEPRPDHLSLSDRAGSEDPPEPLAPALDRRAWLAGVASAGALALAGPLVPTPGAAAVASSFPADTLARLAWGLTGYVVPDRQALRDLTAALAAQVGPALLARLDEIVRTTEPAGLDQAIRAAGLDPAAQAVVRALYTGMVPGPDGPRVITYAAALAWQACDFTKPPAQCGGPTNYWADPPAGRPR